MRVGYVKADAQPTRHFPVNLAVTSEDNITFTSFAEKKKKAKQPAIKGVISGTFFD